MIKAVIFDVDGVLLDSFEANLKFFQDLMLKTGYPPPTREEFPSVFHLNMKDAIKVLTKSESDEEIQRIWELGKNRVAEYPVDLLKMPKGAGNVIKELSNNYLLGIVTNRIRETVFEAPKLAELKDYFKAVVSYPDTVNHKPHPEPLLLACEKLNVLPREAVYIGDAQSDLEAAKAAGTKVIIYSGNQLSGADACISDFNNLLEVIKNLYL